MKRKIVMALCATLLIAQTGLMTGCGNDKSGETSAEAVQDITETEEEATELADMGEDTLNLDELDQAATVEELYLSDTEEETVTVVSALTAGETTTSMKVSAASDIYTAASDTAAVLGSLSSGTYVDTYNTEPENGWYKIVYNGHVCYLKASAATAASTGTTAGTTGTTGTGRKTTTGTTSYTGSYTGGTSTGGTTIGGESDDGNDSGGNTDGTTADGGTDGTDGGSTDDSHTGGTDGGSTDGGSTDGGTDGGSAETPSQP